MKISVAKICNISGTFIKSIRLEFIVNYNTQMQTDSEVS